MELRKNSYPVASAPDVGLVLISEWEAGPEDLIDSLNRSMDLVEHEPWPRGLISYSCFLSDSGRRALHYVQWKDERSHLDYVTEQLPERLKKLEGHIRVREEHYYGRFRIVEHLPRGGQGEPSGVAIAYRQFDTSIFDAPELERQLQAFRSRYPAGTAQRKGAHLHVTVDGHATIDYTEFYGFAADELLTGRIYTLYRSYTVTE